LSASIIAANAILAKQHWHAKLAAQFGGKPNVLVSEVQGKARRVVLVGEKSVIKSVELALAPAKRPAPEALK
jgi:hypothetical protein